LLYFIAIAAHCQLFLAFFASCESSIRNNKEVVRKQPKSIVIADAFHPFRVKRLDPQSPTFEAWFRGLRLPESSSGQAQAAMTG